MQVQKAYAYVQIGLHLRLLRVASAELMARPFKVEFERLTKHLERLNFKVSRAALTSIRADSVAKRLEALNDDETLGELASDLGQLAKDVEQVVFAEGVTMSVFVLPERRFRTEYLLGAPEKLLKDGAYAKLPLIARTDIASAGRCLLFGEATASAYHMLRATEAVLKVYYFHHRKTKRLEKPMWGPMTDQLRAKKRGRPDATLIAALDVVRTGYRNPTQHPEATYEIDGAEDLMGVCLDLVGKMAAEL
jgi:hypothetical protein